MIERLSRHTRSVVIEQNRVRRTWVEHDTPQAIDRMILEERQELDEAVEEAMIGGSAFAVASEVGDVFYLYAKRVSQNTPIPEEVIEAVRSTAEIADRAGIDIESATMMKILRNDMKYLHSLTSNGYDYEQARQLCKKNWQENGGDSSFSHAYIQIAFNVEEVNSERT